MYQPELPYDVTMPELVKNYLLVTKPGIILGNLITAAAGFFLAAKGQIDFARSAADPRRYIPGCGVRLRF